MPFSPGSQQGWKSLLQSKLEISNRKSQRNLKPCHAASSALTTLTDNY